MGHFYSNPKSVFGFTPAAQGIVLGFLLSVSQAAPAVPTGLPVREFPVVQASALPVIPAERLENRRENWFGIYEVISGSKIGWYFSSQSPGSLNSLATIRFLNRSKFVFLQDGVAQSSELEETYHFANRPPYGLISLSLVETKANSRRVTEVVLGKAGDGEMRRYVATISEGRERRGETLLGLKLTALDLLAAPAWAAHPERRPGQELQVAALDARDLVPYTQKFTFLSPHPEAPTLLQLRCENLQDGEHSDYTYASNGELAGGVLGGATLLLAEPKAKAQEITPVDLFHQSLVPCDHALGDILKLKHLELTLKGPVAESIPGSAHQCILSRGPGFLKISSGPQVGLARVCTPEEKSGALQASARLPLGHPSITKLLATALGEPSPKTPQLPRDKVARLVKFVKDYVKDDLRAGSLSIWEILQSRHGDCKEHALLFMVLARAAGIPCREVTGYLYLGDNCKAFGGHAWNEVVLDGKWHEVDATWGLMQVTPAHVMLASGKATLNEMRALSGGNSIQVDLMEPVAN